MPGGIPPRAEPFRVGAALLEGLADLVRDWKFVGDELWARKSYQRLVCASWDSPPWSDECYRGVEEDSTFELWHRPG